MFDKLPGPMASIVYGRAEKFYFFPLLRRIVHKKYRISVDNLKHVVQIVGYPSRKASHGFHLLGLEKLGFHVFFFGNIFHNP